MKDKNPVLRLIYEYAVIIAGSAIYALGFDWCFVPNHIAFGGLTGVAQIINAFIPAWPIGIMIIVMNVPLFIIGLILLGKKTLISSLFAMFVGSLMIDGLAALHTFEPMEPLLACIYGGVLMGLSGGMLMLVDTTTGGTELAARLLKFKMGHLSIGKLCMALDLIVVCAYAAVFNNVHNALYGIVALYITSIVMDAVVYGPNNAKVAYIISDNPEPIVAELLKMDRGVTILDGEGAFTGKAKKVVMVAFKRRQIMAIKRIVRDCDPKAFVIVYQAHEILGEGFGEYTDKSL
jgi:uncharacterized membrane-anchored protein YitT (DUF2179 family)